MTRTSRLQGLDPSARIRLAFAVLTLILAVIDKSADLVVPWLLLVVVLDLVVVSLDNMPVARRGVVNSLILMLLAASAGAAPLEPESSQALSMRNTPSAW